MIDDIYWLPPPKGVDVDQDSLYGDLCRCVEVLRKPSEIDLWDSDEAILECRDRIDIEFEDKRNQSLAIMQTTEEQQRRMAQASRQVAIESRVSASESAEAFFFLASAGLDAEQSISALPQVTKFAQAGMFDMALATDLATDSQSALGLTVKDAEQNLTNLTRVTDVLVKANTLANASVQQFAEALTTKSGSALKVTNKSIEEGVAVLSAFADRGVKGAEAGESTLGIIHPRHSHKE